MKYAILGIMVVLAIALCNPTTQACNRSGSCTLAVTEVTYECSGAQEVGCGGYAEVDCGGRVMRRGVARRQARRHMRHQNGFRTWRVYRVW